MNKGMIGAASFIAGVAVGIFATYKVVKRKCQQEADDEINAMREYYINRNEKKSGSEISEKQDITPEHIIKENAKYDVFDKSIMDNYEKVVERYNYSQYSKPKEKSSVVIEDIPDTKGKAYPINQEEFGGIDEYEANFLTYWADDILSIDEDQDQVIYNDELKEKFDELTIINFAKSDEEVMWLRNDELESDYEITKDDRNYRDIYYDPYLEGDK